MRPMTQKDLEDIRENFPLQDCLTPPDLTVSPQAAQAFDELLDATLQKGPGAVIEYNLAYPKYLFLDYLAGRRNIMLHGSQLCDLTTLEPVRNSDDLTEFGDQPAIYGTQDPLWSLFFAVLERNNLQGPIHNGAIWVTGDDGVFSRHYYFCIDIGSLRRKPWKPGAMYLLPKEGFEPDPGMAGVRTGKFTLTATHWLCRSAKQPLARLMVEPTDFPFLNQVWGYDLAAFDQRMSAESLAGFPFLNDPLVFPIRP